MSVLSVINELKSTGSVLEKQKILESNKDNLLLKEVVKLTYDNSYNFYIRKLPDDIICLGERDLEWALDQLSVLYTRAKTGHAAIAHLTYILNSVSDEDSEVICKIISRDLGCGMASGIVNKVWDNLIPDLPLMLAQPMKDKFIKKIKYPAMAQVKEDGARCEAIVTEHSVTLYSRNYKEYFGLDDICAELTHIHSLTVGSFVFDGELVCVDHHGKDLPRKTSNGIINKASKGTISKKEAAMVRFKVWDVIPIDNFYEGIHTASCLSRYEEICSVLSSAKTKLIFPIESHIVHSLDDAKAIFKKYVEQGREGIILKNMNAPWENKRSNNQVKFKVEIMSDFIVEDLIEGTGKYVGMLGAITCVTRDNLLRVNVGSGFKDEEREYFWQNKDEILGKVVEVKHNGVIESKGKDTASVFLPIFQYVRDDKSPLDADTLDSIDG